MTVMFVGIGFVALLTAYIADRFIRQETQAVDEHERNILAALRRINERLDRLEQKR